MATNNVVNVSLSGQTGTAKFVGSDTPNIITPIVIGPDLNEIMTFTGTTGATNHFNMTSNTTGNPPSLAVAGGDTNIQMQLQGKGNLGAAVQGRTDGNNSSAGYLGQIITSSVAFASAITLVSGTVANITSISLTAGNWMLVGNVYVNNSSSGLETVYGGINTASATMPDQSTLAVFGGTALSLINEFGGNIGAVTFLTATTTYYLVVFSAFTLGTSKGCGYITAIRIS